MNTVYWAADITSIEATIHLINFHTHSSKYDSFHISFHPYMRLVVLIIATHNREKNSRLVHLNEIVPFLIQWLLLKGQERKI